MMKKCDSSIVDRYKQANPKNLFEFAQKYSSNDSSNNLFNIYLEKEIFLMPNERVLATVIEYNPSTFVLPCPDFYGPSLKMEFEIKHDDYPIMKIYIHNTSKNTISGIPQYGMLGDGFSYLGDAQMPVYYPKKGKLIAIGVRAKYDFDLEDLYTLVYLNVNFLNLHFIVRKKHYNCLKILKTGF